jgi:hypothetical protein
VLSEKVSSSFELLESLLKMILTYFQYLFTLEHNCTALVQFRPIGSTRPRDSGWMDGMAAWGLCGGFVHAFERVGGR